MRLREHEKEAAYQNLFENDKALWEFLKVGDDVIEWMEAQPIYLEYFLTWARDNNAIMNRWKDYCSECVSEMGEE